jgi:capsular polysaccharide export protein
MSPQKPVVNVWRFPLWKWRFVRAFLPEYSLRFVQQVSDLSQEPGILLLWGRTPVPPGVESWKIWRMEDGFLRSVGLGAELTQPLSWVLDQQGIYYDATRPSDLECLLQDGEFGDLTRAERLRHRLVAKGISKYNVGQRDWWAPRTSRVIVLVPGQVETDAAIALGSPVVRENLQLLRRVRERHPDAFLIYKPHPDVLARLRQAGKGEDGARELCDLLLTDVAMESILPQVDRVEVMSSLTGFEALLRGKAVTCHGQPFYSGWGLTEDLAPLARRQRQRSLDELVAAVLIHYPRYLNRRRNLCSPEQCLEELVEWKKRQGRRRWWREPYRFLLRRINGVR